MRAASPRFPIPASRPSAGLDPAREPGPRGKWKCGRRWVPAHMRVWGVKRRSGIFLVNLSVRPEESTISPSRPAFPFARGAAMRKEAACGIGEADAQRPCASLRLAQDSRGWRETRSRFRALPHFVRRRLLARIDRGLSRFAKTAFAARNSHPVAWLTSAGAPISRVRRESSGRARPISSAAAPIFVESLATRNRGSPAPILREGYRPCGRRCGGAFRLA